MSVQIKYKNTAGNLITSQQVQNLDYFDKITFVDDQIKMIESKIRIRNGSRTTISYYLSNSENKQEILNKFTDADKNQNCNISFNKQNFGEFGIWDDEEYSKEGDLRHRGKHTLDSKGRIIFSCGFDLQSNQLLDRSFKSYYLGDDMIFTFTYDNDGSIITITDHEDRFGYYAALDLQQFIEEPMIQDSFFSWNEHPYYHSAYPFLPNSLTI